jgi:hypothetical protein
MMLCGAICQAEDDSNDEVSDPMSEPTVRVPLRIPASLKAKLTELAEREHRSLNKQIEFLLDRCIRDGVEEEADDSVRLKGTKSRRG